MTPEQLTKETDRCVKCGLCLPHCPTYRLTRDEGDSPRGRIALIQALASGALDTPRLVRHLDRCLGCRGCESVCPSSVHYGDIIDAARSLKARQGHRRQRNLLELLARLPYWRGTLPLLRHYQKSGARRLLRRLAGQQLQRLDDMLPDINGATRLGPALPKHKGTNRGTHSRVTLFTGCVGRIIDYPAIQASLEVLTQLNVSMSIPPDQGCCGAMHQHNGLPERALELARANSKAFDIPGSTAVIYLASGCGAQLADYGRLGTPLGTPAMEICHYLEASGLAASLFLAPIDQKVAVHTPCSLRYPLQGGDWVVHLLQRIPDIDLLPLQDTGCCGAAGTYVLTQPDMADRLRAVTLEAIEEAKPQILITSNTGCAMHLIAGLKQQGSNIEVLHPIQLIQRQMRGLVTGE